MCHSNSLILKGELLFFIIIKLLGVELLLVKDPLNHGGTGLRYFVEFRQHCWCSLTFEFLLQGQSILDLPPGTRPW